MLNTETAVILAAGMGQRLHRLSGELPKPLMPFCDAPLIEHVMLGAREAGIERFVIVEGHQAGMVRRWFATSGLNDTPVLWNTLPRLGQCPRKGTAVLLILRKSYSHQQLLEA